MNSNLTWLERALLDGGGRGISGILKECVVLNAFLHIMDNPCQGLDPSISGSLVCFCLSSKSFISSSLLVSFILRLLFS